ncbi:MAG: purine-cytosine permease family protein [Rubrobacter sp.]
MAASVEGREGLGRQIERRSIDYVPEDERHGKVWHQGPFWFLGNFQFFTITIGFIGPGLGLSLGWTVLAGTAGILFGTLFMAFHAIQGAQLGLPQMVQSRAQLGYRGVLLALVATFFTFVAFNVVDSVLISAGLNGLFGWNGTVVIVAIAAVAALFAIYGHDYLHTLFRVLFYISLPLYVILTVAIFAGGAGGSGSSPGGFVLVAFMAQFTASASYNITYAPYVSDYSRYLPRHTRPRSIIAAVFFGASGSAVWLIALGAWLATRLGATDALVSLRDAGDAVFGGLGVVLALSSVAALVATMGINAYGAMLTTVTAIDAFRKVEPTRRLRVVTIVALAVLWVVVSLSISAGAVDVLFAALIMMLYLLSPWTALNLVDYFFVRHGRYAITELFVVDGLYGTWAWRGSTAFLAGFMASIPFWVLPGIWTAPLGNVLQGIDVAWLVGLLVSGTTYYILSRSLDIEAEKGEVRASEQELEGDPTGAPSM